MSNILALGNAACNIVTALEQYGAYNIYRIQNEGKKSKNTHIIPELETAEEYENLKILSKISFFRQIWSFLGRNK